MLKTNTILIRLLKESNKTVFAAVYDQYFGSQYAYAVKYVLDNEVAKEMVQDSFLKLWEKRNSLSEETQILPLLYQITRNNCLNHLKHEKVREKHKTRMQKLGLNYMAISHSSAEKIIAQELEESISKAISLLPPRCREIFELSRNQEKKYREIAAELNISEKTVENQVLKALKIMREKLSEYLPCLIITLIYFLFSKK
jgi:RNA polymerase sigma-70 factor (ECF subfamily)